jgi:hypothetical protein
MHSRKSCSPDDGFDSIWRKFFRDLRFSYQDEGQEKSATLDQLYDGKITPDDVLREINQFPTNSLPIFVIDEFNEIRDGGEPRNPLVVLAHSGQ